MDLGDVLVVGAKKNGDLSIIKELESITNSNIGSRNKRKNLRNRKRNSKRKIRNKRSDFKTKQNIKSKTGSRDTQLCKSCGNYECINRRPYKTSCSSYVRCRTSRFKTFKGNHGNTGSGSRIYRA